MTDTHVMRIQQHEVDAIKAPLARTIPPILMLNQNRYTASAGYPPGSEYQTYIAVMEQTIQSGAGYCGVPL